MRRRDLIAGLGSLGVLGAGGVIALGGTSSLQSRIQAEFGEDVDQLEIETADVRGSDAGTIELPSLAQPTFIDFFGTWCSICQEQMPDVVRAHEEYGDEILFVSVTNEAIGTSVSEDELADWWLEYDGNWTVGIDRTAELAERYNLSGYPLTVTVDEHGRTQWSEQGAKTFDELADGIEQAL